ncbi:MAG TPA: hypothetical protein P5568_13345 [Acidobacteriota bacterium]|nr:hypothetical protein [Acidobacteriota bacterium]
MPNYISVVLLACVVPCGVMEAQQPERVSFCDLIKEAGKFDGRVVTVTASYRYGFEWQELFCVSCRGAGRVWLNLGEEPSKTLARELRRLPKHQGTINGTFTGVFRGKASAYGDGGYKYQLDLSALTGVDLVSKSGAMPEVLPAPERKRLYECDPPSPGNH